MGSIGTAGHYRERELGCTAQHWSPASAVCDFAIDFNYAYGETPWDEVIYPPLLVLPKFLMLNK